MLNFLAATNLSDGSVTGCLTPTLPTVCSSSTKEHDALAHAKPLIIQGAWLAATAHGGSASVFKPFKAHMQALLAFWDRPPRRDAKTGLRCWHDQMETGADNGVLSQCPSARSICWTKSQAYTLASADVLVYLQREHIAYASFLEAWGDDGALHHRRMANELKDTLNRELWREDLGYHIALNTSTREAIEAKTYVIALPLWAGLVNKSQAEAIAHTLALLQATGAGKVANKLKKSQTALAVRARALVDKWKALAAGA